MKRPLVLLVTLLAALAVPVTVPAPAHAKGPTEVVVSGPGIDDVTLQMTRRGGDVDVWLLAEATGLYRSRGAPATDQPDLSDPGLGPRYVLTWSVGAHVLEITHVYPFANDGAWATMSDASGWVRGGRELRRAMVELGAEQPGADAEPAVAAPTADPGEAAVAPAAGAGTPPPATSSVPTTGVAGLAALVVLLGFGAWLLRRRTGTLAAWSLHRST